MGFVRRHKSVLHSTTALQAAKPELLVVDANCVRGCTHHATRQRATRRREKWAQLPIHGAPCDESRFSHSARADMQRAKRARAQGPGLTQVQPPSTTRVCPVIWFALSVCRCEMIRRCLEQRFDDIPEENDVCLVILDLDADRKRGSAEPKHARLGFAMFAEVPFYVE